MTDENKSSKRSTRSRIPVELGWRINKNSSEQDVPPGGVVVFKNFSGLFCFHRDAALSPIRFPALLCARRMRAAGISACFLHVFFLLLFRIRDVWPCQVAHGLTCVAQCGTDVEWPDDHSPVVQDPYGGKKGENTVFVPFFCFSFSLLLLLLLFLFACRGRRPTRNAL